MKGTLSKRVPTPGIYIINKFKSHLMQHGEYHREIGTKEANYSINFNDHTDNGPSHHDQYNTSKERNNSLPFLQDKY